MTAFQVRARTELTAQLREARTAAGLTGAALAERLGSGWAQPKISKIESGKQLPSEAEVRSWAAATGADGARLLDLRSRALHEYAAYEDRFDAAGGADRMQVSIGEAEQAASVVRVYLPNLVPGLLQTPEYARAVITSPGGPLDAGKSADEVSRMIAARVRRQAILYEPGREIVLLFGEAALHTLVADAETMREQIRHIARLATTTNATIGVVPFRTAAPVIALHGWSQLDDVVSVETISGALEIADPAELAKYERFVKLLADVAICGPELADFCRGLT